MLAEYGIQDGTTLFLHSSCTCCFFDIDVEWVVGRIVNVIRLRVTHGDTVHSIKRLLHEKLDIPVDRQRLSFEGDALEDDTKLLKCGFITGSTLDLRVD